jgi:hypothetical protein
VSNATPCPPCSNDSYPYLPVKDWDASRTISVNTINKQWAHDQASSK